MFSKLSDGERGDVSANAGAGMGVRRSMQRPGAHLRAAARLLRAGPALAGREARRGPRRVAAHDQTPHRRTHEDQTGERTWKL